MCHPAEREASSGFGLSKVIAAVFVAGVILGTALGLWWALRTPATPAQAHVPSAIGVSVQNASVEAINAEFQQRIFKAMASSRFFELRTM